MQAYLPVTVALLLCYTLGNNVMLHLYRPQLECRTLHVDYCVNASCVDVASVCSCVRLCTSDCHACMVSDATDDSCLHMQPLKLRLVLCLDKLGHVILFEDPH